jgi:hypothetical protein
VISAAQDPMQRREPAEARVKVPVGAGVPAAAGV